MKHKFVEFIPEKIAADTLYISIEYNVAKHKCACGCGDEIVTSLSPSRWSLYYDGETVSLYPSIGNWTHNCKSHYYIKNDKIVWASKLPEKIINETIENDKYDLENHINRKSRNVSLLEKIVSKLRKK